MISPMDQKDSAAIMDWFRSHHGAPTDAKFPMLAKRAGVAVHEVAFVWWALLDFASQNDPRGSITGFDPEALACFSGLDEAKIKAVEGVCREKGMIDEDDMLSAWQRRQPKREDDSSGRVRAFRERQKDETQGNADVTQRNGRAEKSRTEQNTAEESKPGGAVAPPPFDPVSIPGLDADAWGLWVEHRKAIKKPIRPHSMSDAAEELAKLGDRQLAEVKRARAGGWQGLHPENHNGHDHAKPATSRFDKLRGQRQ